MLQDPRAGPRVQLGQGIIQQENRRAADRLRHGSPLRQAQRQRHQSLLATRSTAPEITPVEFDHHVITVRAQQGHPAARLLAEPALEDMAKSVLRRVVPERTPVLEMNLAATRQLGIQTRQLPLNRPDRRPSPAEQLEPHPDELLVPWLELCAEIHHLQPSLEETIASLQDLAVPTPRRQVGWVELPSEAVEEITPRLGRSVNDSHVLPAEGNDAGPCTAFSRHRPDPVLARLDHAPETSRPLSSPQLTCHHRGLWAVPARELRCPGPAEGSSDQEDPEPLQEIGLPPSIGARNNVEARRRREGEGVEVPKIGELYGLDMHPIAAPMRTQILMGMITQSEPSSSKLLTTPGLNPSFSSSTTCSPVCAPNASRT